MLLAIDAGNTHVVFGVYEAERLEATASCRVVGVSWKLADRAGLAADLEAAPGYEVLLTELKAAAVDVACEDAIARGAGVVFVDTVGFVRKLPPSLVASFRSTLAEIRDADVVLHVLDAASARVDEERRVAADVLEDLGVEPERILPVRNKTDLPGAQVPRGEIGVSASTGGGMEALERVLRARVRPEPDRFTLEIPYSNARAIAESRAAFRVLDEKDQGESLRLRIAGERRNLGSLSRFVEEDEAASEPARVRRRAR